MACTGTNRTLSPLALDAEVHHALAALDIADPEPAEFLAADAVIEQGGEDGPIAHALERVVGRRFEQLAGLSIAERRASSLHCRWPSAA